MGKLLSSVVLLYFFLFSPTIRAAEFTAVGDSVAADAVDVNPGNTLCETAAGNGICTLRAAIMEANALPGPDVIRLAAGTYTLSIPRDPASPDDGNDGDLDITQDLSIVGAGAQQTTVEGNGAVTGDRVFHISPGGEVINVVIQDLTVRGGHSADGVGSMPGEAGGGILIGNSVSAGTVTLNRLAISNNLTGDGGPTPSNPGATGGLGGGLAINRGVVTLSNSTVSANTTGNGGPGGPDPGGSGGPGGGIAITGNSIVTLENNTISGNLTGNGNSGFGSGNGGNGGGLVVFASSTTFLNNCTITENMTGTGFNPAFGGGAGGGMQRAGGPVILKNTIVAGNILSAGGFGPDCLGTFTSLGFNLIGDNSNCAGFTGVGDKVGDVTGGEPALDPGLDPLANYGGPTATHRLQATSPALDAGNPATPGSGGNACEAADQRGQVRPVDGDNDGSSRCDIGAHELGICSNGNVEIGEACDGGQCCTAACQLEAAGTSCDDGDQDTVSDACNAAGLCAGIPLGGGSGGSGGGCGLAANQPIGFVGLFLLSLAFIGGWRLGR